jgi:hypothetical protein
MAKCFSCGKESRGGMPTARINGEQRTYCADCYWKVEKEYKGKKSCDECSYFAEETCKKKGKKLECVTIGFTDYYPDAEKCSSLSTDKDVAISEIHKLEKQGKFEEAAAGYDRWGMTSEAQAARQKAPTPSSDIDQTVKDLAKSGQTLTYHCPHCGTALKVGAKNQTPQKFCNNCRGDLSVIDLGKFIEQHAEK